jgi:hypothetical protein
MALCIVSLQVLSAGFARLGGHAGQMSRETHSMLMLERRTPRPKWGSIPRSKQCGIVRVGSSHRPEVKLFLWPLNEPKGGSLGAKGSVSIFGVPQGVIACPREALSGDWRGNLRHALLMIVFGAESCP